MRGPRLDEQDAVAVQPDGAPGAVGQEPDPAQAERGEAGEEQGEGTGLGHIDHHDGDIGFPHEDVDAAMGVLEVGGQMLEQTLIREQYEAELDLLTRTWDEFKSLHSRLIIDDEVLWRELRDRYGDYFEGSTGADAIKSLIDRIDFDVEEQRLRAAIEPGEGKKPLSAQRKQKAIKRLKIVASFNKRDEHGRKVNSPKAMILEAEVGADSRVHLGSLSAPLRRAIEPGRVKVAVRPQAWQVQEAGAGHLGLAGVVLHSAYLGAVLELRVRTELGDIFVVCPQANAPWAVGGRVVLQWGDHGVSVLPQHDKNSK